MGHGPAVPRAADKKKSVEVWKDFHDKDNAKLVQSFTGVAWPSSWDRIGRCITIYYASDKWEPDGRFINYYHDHGSSISIWMPRGMTEYGSRGKPPVRRWPSSGAVLGKCLGWEFDPEVEGSEVVEAFPARGEHPLLCSFPNRKVLFVYEPSKGVIALVEGPGLVVESRGVVG